MAIKEARPDLAEKVWAGDLDLGEAEALMAGEVVEGEIVGEEDEPEEPESPFTRNPEEPGDLLEVLTTHAKLVPAEGADPAEVENAARTILEGLRANQEAASDKDATAATDSQGMGRTFEHPFD
jgi:hypothetical protein